MKRGDKVWPIFHDGSPDGSFWGIGSCRFTGPVTFDHIESEGSLVIDNEENEYPAETVFGTKREALAEAIRLNEGLSSELTLDIARLKEELEAA